MWQAALLMGAGTVLKAYSAYAAQREVAATANYNSIIESANNTISQAAYDYQIEEITEAGQQATGKIISKIGKSGFAFEGSPLRVLQESMKNVAQDVIVANINKSLANLSSEQKRKEFTLQSSVARRRMITDTMQSLAESGTSILLKKYGG